MSKTKVAIGVAVVAGLGGLAWAFLPAGEDPQVAKVVELQSKLFTENPQVPRAEQRKAWEELRTESEKLTPEQQMKIMRDNPPPMMKAFQQHVVDYFDLPKDQKQAHLDKAIDEMERRRKEFETRMAERKQGAGGPGGGGGGAVAGGGGPRGGHGGFGGGNDPARRQQFAKAILDNTTPQQRAMFSDYFRDMQQRRKERGLPDMGGPFGRDR